MKGLSTVNKLSIIIFLFSLEAMAGSPDTIIVLEAKSSRGKTLSKDIVFVKDGTVIVNREKLSAPEVITQSEHLTKIASFNENDPGTHCASGTFKHTMKKGKILKIEKGCLASDRFKS